MRYLLVATLVTVAVLAFLDHPSERWQLLSDDFQFFNPDTDSLATVRITRLIIMPSDSLVAYGHLATPSGWHYLELCFSPAPAITQEIINAYPTFAGKEKQLFAYLGTGNKIKLEIVISYSIFLLRQKGEEETIYLGLPAAIYRRV